MLKLENISYRYPGRDSLTLKDISLSLGSGEMLLLAGRSGCGKSTLIKTISGLVSHRGSTGLSGRILLDGEDITGWPPEEIGQLAGTVYQTPDDQLFAMTVADETGFALENRGADPETVRKEVARTLAMVGLAGMEDYSIHQLSGGQRQRLALASILITSPKLLILDEPVSQMNPQGVEDFMKLLLRLNREEGIAILMIEHRVNELAGCFDRLAVMQEGRIVYDGPMEEAWSFLTGREDMGLREPQSVKLGRLLGFPRLTSDTAESIRMLRECMAEMGTDGNDLPTAAQADKLSGSVAMTGGDECNMQNARAEGNPSSGGELAAKTDKTEDNDNNENDRNNGNNGNDGRVILSARNLFFTYPGAKEPTLKGLDFDLRRHQITALMGFNGAGKSTLLNLLGGLTEPTAGSLELDGRKLRKELGETGYLLQESDLMLLADTVWEELRWKNRHITDSEAEVLLEKLNLTVYRDDFPLALSKGQRLRVVLGAMLARKPKLLLLDEPTTGQDERSLTEIKRLLALFREEGGSVFLCTHDLELAAQVADRVILLTEGEILAEGPARHILSDENLLRRSGLLTPPVLTITKGVGLPPCVLPEEVCRHVHATAMGRD